ncbi:hypothetical protein PACTADRAFT_16895 [Pachysolen tannophilus NRRL Y-2460]|uniref:Protein kinase domain-containing protein n=1 Tax=Pachysolen tannophilus NRRL Y-2460 TaxID=669874 RepID=A0A1E4TUG0_PACTA|nr:hypothetical protein PACTADRAFT_16895 [Pachysolen tannophilus NRRL Y-2460]
MSVVLYKNDELKIVLNHPPSDALILYNKSKNTFEIVKSNLNSSSGSEINNDDGGNSNYTFYGSVNDNLGGNHVIDRHEAATGKSGVRSSTHLSGDGYLICPNCGYNIQFHDGAQGFNDTDGDHNHGFNTDSNAIYMDSNYFKLLANLDYEATNNNEVDTETDSETRTHNLLPRLSASIEEVELEDGNSSASFDVYGNIPKNLFSPNYFHKFFKILEKLGNGSNGVVFKVEHNLSDLTLGVFALKKIGIGNNIENLEKILKEVNFLYSLTNNNSNDHDEDNDEDEDEDDENFINIDGTKNLVNYNHVWLEIDNISTFGPKIPCVFILFEYCDGGNLETLIANLNKPKGFLEKKALLKTLKKIGNKNLLAKDETFYLNNFEIFKIFKDICSGVYKLHKNHIIHRDLKPSNCLLKKKIDFKKVKVNSVHDMNRIPVVCVSDFGESIFEGTKRESSGYTGTLEYTAPELLVKCAGNNSDRLNEFNKKTDIYSLGLILYYLCFNKLPYGTEGNYDAELIRHKIKDYYQNRSEYFFLYDNKEILNSRKIIDIENLAEIDKTNDSYLLKDFIDLINSMCNINPSKRPFAKDVIITLDHIYEKLKAISVNNESTSDSRLHHQPFMNFHDKRSSADTLLTVKSFEKEIDPTDVDVGVGVGDGKLLTLPYKDYNAHFITYWLKHPIFLLIFSCFLLMFSIKYNVDLRYLFFFLLGYLFKVIV